MGANVFRHPQTQRDGVRMFTQVNGSPFDSVRRRQTPETVLEFPDTEEVTGSNPVRPTRHFLFLALPGSALWPYNWPYSEGEDIPWSQTAGYARSSPQADTSAILPCRHAIEHFRDQVVVKSLFENSPVDLGVPMEPGA